MWLLGVAGVAAFAGIAYVVLDLAPNWFAETEGLDAKGRADARQGVRTASLALLAGTVAVIGAVYTARTFALNRAGQLTDRFTKAIEQLGHEQLDVRLGGIYALERIARDSEEDHPQVVEVLTAYVRGHSPRQDGAFEPPDAPDPAATDVLAVLTVLGRRAVAHEKDTPRRLDLASTNLRGSRLERAQLRQADLSKADLSWAMLSEAKLSESDFMWAVLRKAALGGADLTHAVFYKADLTAAELAQADLRQANLAEANLIDAHLFGANLRRAALTLANLSNANLGRADLREADLAWANLSAANFSEARLNNARLNNADLTGAILVGADLSGATLQDAALSGARYDRATVWPGGFNPEAAGASEMDPRQGGENPEPPA